MNSRIFTYFDVFFLKLEYAVFFHLSSYSAPNLHPESKKCTQRLCGRPKVNLMCFECGRHISNISASRLIVFGKIVSTPRRWWPRPKFRKNRFSKVGLKRLQIVWNVLCAKIRRIYFFRIFCYRGPGHRIFLIFAPSNSEFAPRVQTMHPTTLWPTKGHFEVFWIW